MKMIKRLISLVLTSLLLSSCSVERADTDRKAPVGYRQITAKEAEVMMREEENYIILDVRTPEEFKEKHIKGAINIPNENIGEEEIPALPDKDCLILVYCRSGNRSKQAAEKLVKLGYTNVVEFGGIIDWRGETEVGE